VEDRALEATGDLDQGAIELSWTTVTAGASGSPSASTSSAGVRGCDPDALDVGRSVAEQRGAEKYRAGRGFGQER
jgi:hypothetical protein